ncbi:MAG: energy-coupling factor transporter ATPase [Oscillospiraceae bacterium]
MENAIEIRHLAYSYPDDTATEHVVFQDLSLDIEQGSFVAVLGHNGCGKSTLAKHLNAILLPEGGTVTVYGLDTKQEENLLAIRQQVGMVFQNPDNQIVSNVVEEDVAFAPENLGVPSEEIRRRVDEALEAVGMAAYKKHAPHLLSGGQKQRVAIAGVLAMQPKTIVLDEPTAMLDPQGRQEVVSIVEKLSREQNITVILITHHMDEAICADRVIAMDDGKIIADGAPKDVFTKIDLLQSVGLTAPQTTLLLKALDDDGCALPLDALSVDDCAQALFRQISQAKA